MALSFEQKVRPVATSTPSFMSKARPVVATQTAPIEQKTGFVQSIVQGVTNPFLRAGATGYDILSKLKNIATGESNVSLVAPHSYDMGYLGKVKPLGNTGGGFGADMKDALGAGLSAASTIVPAGKVPMIAKATLGGRIAQGAWAGAKSGALSGLLGGAGSELQNPNSSVLDVAGAGAKGAAFGLGTGAIIGGALPTPVAAVKGVKETTSPTNIMNKVARIDPTAARKFQAMSGESHGDYLVKRGIFGSNEDIVKQLADRHEQSRAIADAEIAKLGGTYSNDLITTTLNELSAREGRVSLPGSLSRDHATVQKLVQKNKSGGLTMSEINEMKRLYERNVKTGYLKENNSDKIVQATTLDSNLRNWQLQQARKLGLENLDEINKETQLSKALGDALLKKMQGQSGNNALSLTDAILLAGGDPNSIAMFATKKIAGDSRFKSFVAKSLSGKPTVGLPKARVRSPITDINLLLEAGKGPVVPQFNNGRPIPIMGFGNKEYTGRDIVAGGYKAVLPKSKN